MAPGEPVMPNTGADAGDSRDFNRYDHWPKRSRIRAAALRDMSLIADD